jgi:hypothetical protein
LPEALQENESEALRRLGRLVEVILRTVDGIKEDANDGDSMSGLAPLARAVLIFVVECAPNADDPIAVAADWFKRFLSVCVRQGFDQDRDWELPQIVETRIRMLLSNAQFDAEWLVPVDSAGLDCRALDWRMGMSVPTQAYLGKGTYAAVWRAQDRCTGGILSAASDPRPPCAPRLALLGKNWEKLRESINHPRHNDAQALPNAGAKDFVLRCTDRRPNFTKMTHEDVRTHRFFSHLPSLPDSDDRRALAMWLPESLKENGCSIDYGTREEMAPSFSSTSS